MIEGTVTLDDRKLLVESVIAEGGFGYVHKVRDLQSNEYYALKKINSNDKETQSEIENEIEILKSLQKHPHIMEFVAYSKVSPNLTSNSDNIGSNNGHSNNRNSFKNTYLILCEYCDRGTLSDLELPIQELERSCRIIYQIASALKHMHKIGVIHRDIKAENVLFDNNGRVKLCDFGSSTRSKYEPNLSWTPLERATVEEEMQRHTTPLYRPPEILETYLHYPINCAIDVWALGCLIYFMRFGQHAFPDSGKLSIVNCCYSIAKDVSKDDPLVSIIRQCLKPDPNERLTVQTLMNSLEVEFGEMDLNGSIVPFTPSEIQLREPKSSSSDKIQENLTQLQQDPERGPTVRDQSEYSSSTYHKVSESPTKTIEEVESPESKQGEQCTTKVDTLIEFGNTSSSSTSSFENPRKSMSASNILSGAGKDLAKKAGLTEELLSPRPIGSKAQDTDSYKNLLDMDVLSTNNIADQKILSPKKASIVNKSNSNDKRDAFDDLLESFGATLPSNGAPNINNNRQPIIGSTCAYDGFDLDPIVKITEWRNGRRGNIRALLSSLHLVLNDEFRWKQIGMHQLVTDADVKKIYRSACLAVHPDKVINCDDDTREMAKMVFTELNEAWSKFEGR